MAGLSQPEPYHLVAPLPPLGGWRRVLALNRRGRPAGLVVLSFAPPELTEDPARLAALSRDAEVGARLHHAKVVQVIGLETMDDQLALVEPYHPGTTLRALLDSSGRLPAELAVRIACDAAAGLSALHALDPGDGQPIAHGALTAERILVAEDGSSLVEGVGAGAGRSPAEDVFALAGVLYESLTGEPRSSLAGILPEPGISPALAAVLDKALGDEGGRFGSAAAFTEALVSAFPPATIDAVAVYVGAAAPPPVGLPTPVPEAPEVSAELIAPVAIEATPAVETPAADRTPVPDAAITFRAPTAAVERRRLPLAAVLVALGLMGFAGGFALSRWKAAPWRVAPGDATALPAEPEASAAAPAPVAEPTVASGAAAPAPAEDAPPPVAALMEVAPDPAAPTRAAPAPAKGDSPPRPAVPSIMVSAEPPGEILVDGKSAGRAPVTVEVPAGQHVVQLRDRAAGVDVKRKVKVKAPNTPVRFDLARGELVVTAPADVEVRVDGRFVGKGDQKVELWEGWHEVEMRRGVDRHRERFQLTSEINHWSFTATSTP